MRNDKKIVELTARKPGKADPARESWGGAWMLLCGSRSGMYNEILEKPVAQSELNSEFVKRALQIVQPKADQGAHCRKLIVGQDRCLRAYLAGCDRKEPTPAKRRTELRKAAASLRKAASAIKDLSERSFWDLFFERLPANATQIGLTEGRPNEKRDALCLALSHLATTAERRVDTLRIRKGERPTDVAKFEAAMTAYDLLIEFSSKAPTRTVGGPFYELASLLYESATGIVGADLSRACKGRLSAEAESD